MVVLRGIRGVHSCRREEVLALLLPIRLHIHARDLLVLVPGIACILINSIRQEERAIRITMAETLVVYIILINNSNSNNFHINTRVNHPLLLLPLHQVLIPRINHPT